MAVNHFSEFGAIQDLNSFAETSVIVRRCEPRFPGGMRSFIWRPIVGDPACARKPGSGPRNQS